MRTQLQRAMLAMDDDGNPCQAGGDQPFDQGSPRVGVNDMRPDTAEETAELPDEERIVTVAPVEFIYRHTLVHRRPECTAGSGAADRTSDACAIETVDQLDYTKLYATRFEPINDVDNADGLRRVHGDGLCLWTWECWWFS